MIDVGISLPKRNAAEIVVAALVDSGSDGTLVPTHLLEAIGAKPVGPAAVRGLWGGSQFVNIYLVKFYIGPHQFFAVRVAGVQSEDECILGRNVLNQLVITHNGLAGMIEIAE